MMQNTDDCEKEPHEIIFDFLNNINKKINGHGIKDFGMTEVYSQITNKYVGDVCMGYVYVAALEQKAQNKIYSVNLG